MSRELDMDTRLHVVMVVLIALVVLLGSLVFYFRKKANDTLFNIFRLEDRINTMDIEIQQLRHSVGKQ